MADREAELEKERGVNETYMFELNAAIKRDAGIIRLVSSLQAKLQFLGHTARRGRGPVIEPFAGRVVLSAADEVLGQSFYIGSYRLDRGDLQVISIGAPMARLFYLGSNAEVDIVDLLAGRRTFDRTLNSLDDFEDDIEPGHPPNAFEITPASKSSVESPPAKPSRPTVARPPSPITRPAPAPTHGGPPETSTVSRPEVGVTLPPPVNEEPPVPPTSDLGGVSLDAAAAQDMRPAAEVVEASGSRALEQSPETASQLGRLRAPKTVLKAVTAPRTGRLKSLLATLQPEQYDLVTWPEEDHLIVQGHPGTGKTVIALHRVAYLNDPWRLPKGRPVPPGAVLVLGPTPEYREHVRPLLADLAQPAWEVWSLAHFYARLGEFKDLNLPADPDGVATSGSQLADTVARAFEKYQRRFGEYRGRGSVRDFAKFLFSGSAEMRTAAGDDQEVLSFLTQGKNHEYAAGLAKYHPLLALAGLTVSGVALANHVRHIVVDEAQDLRLIDLRMLKLLVSHGVTLTLVGDMNQRRSDFTQSTWEAVAALIGMVEHGSEIPLRTIETGFRSTNQILRYADGLLPKGERGRTALRDGPEPRTVKVSQAELLHTVLSSASELSQRLGGLTAIITLEPKRLSDDFRAKEWTRGVLNNSWRRTANSPPIVILHPDLARGLEFDAVVVVEPSQFPAKLGRHGVLYTSLTRATKELVVVHTKPLPKELRP